MAAPPEMQNPAWQGGARETDHLDRLITSENSELQHDKQAVRAYPSIARTHAGAIVPTCAIGDRSFDYSGLDAVTVDLARRVADQIKYRRTRIAEEIIGIGGDLISIKDRLGHGRFGRWLEAEFGWNKRTAQRFMAAAEAFAGKCATVSYLPPTIIYQLAAPTTPSAIREEVVASAEAGWPVPVAKIYGMLSEAKEADRKAKEEAARSPQARARHKAERERQRREGEKWKAEHAAAQQKQIEAAEVAARWISQRGDPEEFLALLTQTSQWAITDALTRMISGEASAP